MIRSFLSCSVGQDFQLVPTTSPGPISVALMIMDVVPKKTPYKCTMERQARRFLNPAKSDKFPYVINVLNGLQL